MSVANPDAANRAASALGAQREEARRTERERKRQAHRALSVKEQLEQKREQKRVSVEVEDSVPVEFRPLDGEDSEWVDRIGLRLIQLGEDGSLDELEDGMDEAHARTAEILGRYSTDNGLTAEWWQSTYPLDERADILRDLNNGEEIDDEAVQDFLRRQ